MKKLSLILAGALLMGGISFASPVVKQQPAKAKTAQTTKPVKSKAATTTKSEKKAPVKKAPVKKAPAAKSASTKAVSK